MKLEAAQRLFSTVALTKVEALLDFPVSNTSQRGYLTVIANMLIGARPIGRDCRSVVAKYLCHHPSSGERLVLVGFPDSTDVFHCLLVDPGGKKVVDAFTTGKYEGRHYVYKTPSGEPIRADVVAAVSVKDMMFHLVNNSFPQWVMNFPN